MYRTALTGGTEVAETTTATPWLTAQEAAEYSRLSIATIRRALASGALKGVQGATSRWVIHRDQVDAWLIGETAA